MEEEETGGLQAGPMSRVGGPLIQGDADRAAARPAVKRGRARKEPQRLAFPSGITRLSHTGRDTHAAPISWGMTTATARPHSTVSEVLLRCSFIDS